MNTRSIDELNSLANLWNTRTIGFIGEMNLKIEELTSSTATVRMPFNPNFCADAEATLLHGGILTSLLDSVFGLVNFLAIDDVQTMATVDLRVDYLRPALPGADVLVRAECYRQTRHVAFCTGGVCCDGGPSEEIARGNASFAITRGKGNLLDMIRMEMQKK